MMYRPKATRVGQGFQGALGEGVPEAIRVRLLGGFSVSVGPQVIEESEWRLRKAAGLVKLLALAPEHRMHRERVMDLLWPKLDPATVNNNLRYALHVARRVLEPASTNGSCYLHRQGDELVLDPEGLLWVDVEAFEEAVGAARRLREPSAYQAALDLYAGELLPGDPYEAWAEDRREELERTYLSMLVELAGLHEERQEFWPAIEALGKVVRSEPAHEEAHVDLMRLYALSGRRVEALRQYELLEEALSRDGSTEPAASSRRLYQEIRAGQFTSAQPPWKECPSEKPLVTPRHNLPASRTSFVGRERELVEVKRALVMARLLTLTGLGGSGKTRLALEVAKELVETYSDGVWLVELARLSEPELVVHAVADALEVREQPNHPLAATLAEHLRAKDLLLVLDNCEHLIDAVAYLADALLASCPRLRVLATSREPLEVMGETLWRVPPLSVPHTDCLPDAGEMTRYEAIRLFVERARLRLPTFDLTPENASEVAQVCRRLEGIPLAIELATVRVGALPLGQISERLEDPLKLLTGGSRTATPRQQTLRGTLDWSYKLLSEPEKKLFGRLSVFVGGWTLEAAEVVGAEGDMEEEDVLELLSGLVDKSLVAAEAGEEGALRYRLLEPVLQYGREKLEESEEANAVRRRHAAFFLALAEEAEPELRGARQAAWLEQLKREHDNFRAALSWTLESGENELGLRLGGALGEFWHLQGHLIEGLRWLEAVLANGEGPSSTRMKALNAAGRIAWEQVDFERARAFGEEALTLARGLRDKVGVAAAVYALGSVAMYQRRFEEASTLLEEALVLRRELGDAVDAVRVLTALGSVAVARHDYRWATVLSEEGLSLARKMEDKPGIAFILVMKALATLGCGDYERVKDLCAEGMELARQLGYVHVLAANLHVLASTTGSQGQPVRSARLWGAAEALRESIGVALSPVELYHYDPYITAARAQLDEAAWEAAWAEGKAMTAEEAIEYALYKEESEEPPTGKAADKLTPREREVADLLAQGLTNHQIASKLTLSKRTVDNHVANILKKLNLSSRSEVGAHMEERGPRGSESP